MRFSLLLGLSINDKIYLILLVIVLIVLLLRYSALSPNLRPLVLLTATHLIAEFTADSLHYVFDRNNIIVYHILTPIEYIIICSIFYKTFDKYLLRKSVLASIPVYLFLSLLCELFWEPPTQNNSLAYLTESLLVVFWCFSFFRHLLDQDTEYRPEKDQTFWVIIALLVYFLGNFFILGTMNYFVKNDRVLGAKIYYAGYAFYYLFYLTIGVISLIRFPQKVYE